MRRIIAALAAILVTLGLTVVGGGTAAARGGHDRPTVNPRPFDICDFKPNHPHCRDRVILPDLPFEPIPFPGQRERVVLPEQPFEPIPFRRP